MTPDPHLETAQLPRLDNLLAVRLRGPDEPELAPANAPMPTSRLAASSA